MKKNIPLYFASLLAIILAISTFVPDITLAKSSSKKRPLLMG